MKTDIWLQPYDPFQKEHVIEGTRNCSTFVPSSLLFSYSNGSDHCNTFSFGLFEPMFLGRIATIHVVIHVNINDRERFTDLYKHSLLKFDYLV